MKGGTYAAVARATAFLAAEQQADGSYLSFSSPTLKPFRPNISYRTVFVPALMLQALQEIDNAKLQTVRTGLADWLLDQKSPHWSFNYWARTAPERQTLPYPDDLDDTFCALIALYHHDPSLVGQAGIAGAVKLLLAAQERAGGPYRTWLVSAAAPNAWHDIDLAVNSNIAYFLSLVAEPLPNLVGLMEQAIMRSELCSPYYPSMFAPAYYLARAYTGSKRSLLADQLLAQQKNGHWNGVLTTALAVTACVRLGAGESCQAAARWLLDRQAADGSWPAEAFCIDPAIQNKSHYNGAAALTTAFVLEALRAYDTATAHKAVVPDVAANKPNHLHLSIMRAGAITCAEAGPLLGSAGQAILKRMDQNDTKHEITLLPALFAQAIAPTQTLPAELLKNLGLANLFGWMAYTIFDDILDDEGKPGLLPLATTALRRSQHFFRTALPDSLSFQAYVARTFDTIDEANTWEVTHCRMPVTSHAITISKLPEYSESIQLADRSLGHTLTPLGVLTHMGIDSSSQPAIAVQTALRNYIAARQLSDDLHDWQDDLRRGQITYVVAAILQDIGLRPGRYGFTKLVPIMQRQFWHHTLLTLCDLALEHTAQARTTAAASDILTPINIITQLTDGIEQTIQHTLNEQRKAEDFLTAFRSG